GGAGDEAGQRGLARARRPPEDHRRQRVGLDERPQRPARAEQLLLADHLVERPRAQPRRQRGLRRQLLLERGPEEVAHRNRRRVCSSAARAAFAPQAPWTPPPGWADAEPRYRPLMGVSARPRCAGVGRNTSCWCSGAAPPLTAPPTRLASAASSMGGVKMWRPITRSRKPGARASISSSM